MPLFFEARVEKDLKPPQVFLLRDPVLQKDQQPITFSPMSAPFYFQEFVDARILDMCIPVKLASVVNHHPLDIYVLIQLQ
jgi:hypothetical protein